MIGSLIFVFGALVLAWRGVGGLPRAQKVRYALIWGAIFLGVIVVLRVLGA
ncbi:MAG: hypothetical protein KDE32_02800 [Novosphingobium sp.]|nr:hypothetical protein [Novosphingobium sp.]